MGKQRTLNQPEMPLVAFGVSSPTRVEGAKIQLIPIGKLKPSPYNSRSVRTQERIDEIAESMRVNGQIDPIDVYPGGEEDEGCYFVLGGETRRLAAIQIGLSDIKAIVDTSLSPSDALSLAKKATILNGSQDECDLDRAMFVARLIKQGYFFIDVAEALGLERSRVTRLLKLMDLPEEFRELGKKYPDRYTADVGYYIEKAIDTFSLEFAFSLLEKVLLGQITHSRLEQEIEEGPDKKLPETHTGKRLRREASTKIVIGGVVGGRYSVFRSPNPEQMVLKLQVTLSEGKARELDAEIKNILGRITESTPEGNA